MVKDCPPGTEFNQKSNVCDFPSKANCKVAKRKRKARNNIEPEDDTISSRLQEPRQGQSKEPVVHPSPPSGQRVRLRGASTYKGYLELYHSDQWGLVCDDDWNREEADIVCKQLGFSRGVASTTQVTKLKDEMGLHKIYLFLLRFMISLKISEFPFYSNFRAWFMALLMKEEKLLKVWNAMGTNEVWKNVKSLTHLRGEIHVKLVRLSCQLHALMTVLQHVMGFEMCHGEENAIL